MALHAWKIPRGRRNRDEVRRRPRMSASGLRLFDRRQDFALDLALRDRADMFVDDHAIAVDDKGLGHAIDAEIDAGAPARIRADQRVGIAELAQEAERVVLLVLVNDSMDGNAAFRA